VSSIPEELIAVRDEEGFSLEQLALYLEGRVEGAVGLPEIQQFAGGHANLTYLLTYPTIELVLRRPPLGPVAPGAHDMSREFRVLSRLYRAFPPAPRALLYCDDEALIPSPTASSLKS
jgi:aminoglycoside phosphotransferase (APT) family kinase protein